MRSITFYEGDNITIMGRYCCFFFTFIASFLFSLVFDLILLQLPISVKFSNPSSQALSRTGPSVESSTLRNLCELLLLLLLLFLYFQTLLASLFFVYKLVVINLPLLRFLIRNSFLY